MSVCQWCSCAFMVNKTSIDPNFDLLCCTSSSAQTHAEIPTRCPPQGESGGFDSPGCPRIVGSIQALTNVCRMYLEGCEIFSSFCALSLFSFDLTISLSLSPDCIRIDCNLSKCLLCSLYCILVMSTCSRLWCNPVPLAPFDFWEFFSQHLKLQILLRHHCFNHHQLQWFYLLIGSQFFCVCVRLSFKPHLHKHFKMHVFAH